MILIPTLLQEHIFQKPSLFICDVTQVESRPDEPALKLDQPEASQTRVWLKGGDIIWSRNN